MRKQSRLQHLTRNSSCCHLPERPWDMKSHPTSGTVMLHKRLSIFTMPQQSKFCSNLLQKVCEVCFFAISIQNKIPHTFWQLVRTRSPSRGLDVSHLVLGLREVASHSYNPAVSLGSEIFVAPAEAVSLCTLLRSRLIFSPSASRSPDRTSEAQAPKFFPAAVPAWLWP